MPRPTARSPRSTCRSASAACRLALRRRAAAGRDRGGGGAGGAARARRRADRRARCAQRADRAARARAAARRIREHGRRRHALAARRRRRRSRDRDPRRSGSDDSAAPARGARGLPRRRRSCTATGEAAVRALDGVSLEIRARRASRAARPLRIGQDDASPRARRPGRAEPRAASSGTAGRSRRSTEQRAARVRATGIAYVFQGANLLPYFTAFENVAFAAQLGRGEAQTPRSPHGRCSSSSGSARSSTICRRSCPAARRSASRSRARSPSSRSCCCATSRPGISTPTPASACST